MIVKDQENWEYIITNCDDWIIGSGASNHMTNRRVFRNFEVKDFLQKVVELIKVQSGLTMAMCLTMAS